MVKGPVVIAYVGNRARRMVSALAARCARWLFLEVPAVFTLCFHRPLSSLSEINNAGDPQPPAEQMSRSGFILVGMDINDHTPQNIAAIFDGRKEPIRILVG